MNREQATATALLAGNGICLLKLADVVTSMTFTLPEGFRFSLPALVFISGIGTAAAFALYQYAYSDEGQPPGQLTGYWAIGSPIIVWLALLSLSGFVR